MTPPAICLYCMLLEVLNVYVKCDYPMSEKEQVHVSCMPANKQHRTNLDKTCACSCRQSDLLRTQIVHHYQR